MAFRGQYGDLGLARGFQWPGGVLATDLRSMQGVERLLELVTHPDIAADILIDVQRLEESLVQPATLLIVAASVEPLWVGEELQACLDDLSSQAEILVSVGQPLCKPLTVPSDLVQAGANLVLRQGAIGSQVDEVGLLGCRAHLAVW